MISRVILVGILGPALALFATWYEAVKIARIGAGENISTQIVQQLRDVPSEALLLEIGGMASGIRGFRSLDSKTLVAAAEQLFAGRYEVNGEVREVTVPFDPSSLPREDSTWNLRFCSLIVPRLLSRAYSVSNDGKFIRAAVDYILAWSQFESSLLLPRGAVFNDHAIAARAIVVTEVWRQYRRSEIFSLSKAAGLLHYVNKLSRLLQEERLYQYRTNHGLMQNLSLLHLAIAFPYLDEAEQNIEIGTARMLDQLQYLVNPEGAIQEHSPGYHHQNVEGLSAAWRYFALVGRPVPPELANRYKLALEFDAALLRADGTLPPIGDTRDFRFGSARAVSLDNELVASTPLERAGREPQKPQGKIIAPAAGYAIVWSGLQNWPLLTDLRQTVFTWANFPARAHKHDDELSISIWSQGTQWVRGVGYWPYISSRSSAIGWRGSNGPHWVAEMSRDARSSSLAGTIANDGLSFFDVVRTNSDGRRIRRQLAIVEEDTWVVLDSFESQTSAEAEVIWRFSPGLTLKPMASDAFLIHAPNSSEVMAVSFNLPAGSTVDADYTGDEIWNYGVSSNEGIVRSPAIRLVSIGNRPLINTVFRMLNDTDEAVALHATELAWDDTDNWRLAVEANGIDEIAIERNGSRIMTEIAANSISEWEISTARLESAAVDRRKAVNAFEGTSRRYGRPFRSALELRGKLTTAILVAALAQFFVLIIFKVRLNTRWRAILFANSLAWIAISAYISTMVVG